MIMSHPSVASVDHTLPELRCDLMENLDHDHCVDRSLLHGGGNIALDQVDAISHIGILDGRAGRFHACRIDVHAHAPSLREGLG